MDNVFRSPIEARESWGHWFSEVMTGPTAGTAADPVFLEGVLPQEEFSERLRLEKRRVDRVGNPLSMALFFLKEELLADVKKMRAFLVSINRNTRETDLKGWVRRNVFGLLMLDTDGSRAQKCVDLLVNGRTKTVCDFLTVTYPDRLFHEILEKAEAVSGILPLESPETVGDATIQQVFKRWLDILGALIGLVCFSPVMLITAIAIKLTSPGPIIFRQTRLGRRGNHFDLLSLKNDSRISPVGKIIRKLSLDQLPQFFNVLKGEMSLVGPRPPIPQEVEKFKSGHLRRILAVRPGITGLWQVEGRAIRPLWRR